MITKLCSGVKIKVQTAKTIIFSQKQLYCGILEQKRLILTRSILESSIKRISPGFSTISAILTLKALLSFFGSMVVW